MRKPSAWLSAVAVVAVLTGCGGDGDTEADGASTESAGEVTDTSESPTTEPSESDKSNRPSKSRKTAVRKDRDKSTRPNRSKGSKNPNGPSADADTDARPTRADVRAALLTRNQMPSGWSKVRDDGDGGAGELCDFDIAELLDVKKSALRKADVQFALDEDTGPSVVEALGIVPSGRGSEILGALRDAFADCEDEEVGGMPVTVSELDFPTLADDSAAYEISVGSGRNTLDIPLVYAVSGDLVIGVYAFDFDSDSAVALLDRYATRAVDKALRKLT